MRRVLYASLTALLTVLAVICVVRLWGGGAGPLPLVEQPAELRGRPCADALAQARALTSSGALDRARDAYLWIIGDCDDATVLPDALLEAGSLLGHLMQRPDEARAAYQEFLRRFPEHAGAADALFHLAKLEIDAGRSADAVAHLTLLAQRFPDSPHRESAVFLASRASALVTTNRREQRTLLGQLARIVPNNIVSLLALLAAIGPAIIQAVHQASKEGAGAPLQRRWMLPGILIGLTLLNYVLNNIDGARRDAQLMAELDRLLVAGGSATGDR